MFNTSRQPILPQRATLQNHEHRNDTQNNPHHAGRRVARVRSGNPAGFWLAGECGETPQGNIQIQGQNVKYKLTWWRLNRGQEHGPLPRLARSWRPLPPALPFQKAISYQWAAGVQNLLKFDDRANQ